MRLGLLTYAVKRVVMLIPVLFGVSLISFSLVHLSPGDVVGAILATGGQTLPPGEVQRIRELYHLNEPFYMQYYYWITRVLTGDLGYSYIAQTEVSTRLLEAVWPTVQVGFLGVAFSLLISLPLGILGAVYKDSWIDEASRVLAFGGVSIPRFWLGLMLILVFGQYWVEWFDYGLIETGGYVSITDAGLVEWLRYMLAPAICIGLGYAAITARITRSAMIDELNKDYVTTARAKGLREQLIVGVHVLQNAMLPVVTVVGMQLGFVINGVVVVEEVFAIPGLGRLMFTTVANQDLPTVQALLLLIATAYVIVNLLVDLTYAYLDPRIVYEGEA